MVFRSVLFLFGLPVCGVMMHASASAQTRPFQGERGQIPGKIEAEHYDHGDAEVAYHDVDPQNRGADYREATQVDIEKRPDASGGHGVGWTRQGEWLIYSVTVKKTGTYVLQVPVASNKRGGVFSLGIRWQGCDGSA